MNNKDKHKELLSRRDFFRKAATSTLPFIAAMTIPSIFTSCSSEPIPSKSGCDGCSSSCEGSCDKSCSGSCEESCAGSSSNSGSSCSDCSSSCKNTCSTTCSDSCTGSSTGENNTEFVGVDLGLSVLWATFDIGSTKPDAYPQSYYWGDNTGKATKEEIKALISKQFPYENGKEFNISGTEYDIAHISIGNGWRLPTKIELDELCALCTYQYEKKNGIEGIKIKGPNGKSIFIAKNFATATYVERISSYSSCHTYENDDKRRAYYSLFYKEDNQQLEAIGFSYLLEGQDYVPRIAIRPVKSGGSGCNDCSSGCTTLCSKTCSGGCKETCSGSCKETCSEGCKEGCLGECKETCKYTCQTTCQNECKESCKNTCSSGCSTECTGGCKTGCSGGCKSGCTGGCQTGCSDSCKDQCKGNCSSYCAVSCSNDCSGDCRSGCLGSCEYSCQNTCEGQCTTGCGGSCGFSCSFSCGNTCHKTAF